MGMRSTRGATLARTSRLTILSIFLTGVTWGCQETVAPQGDITQDGVSAAVVAPALSFGYVSPEITTTVEGTRVCRTLTFEGAPHYLPINPEGGGVVPGSNMAFSPNWRTLSRGAYANNPSGVTIAVWLQDAAAEVLFDEPVSSVEFYYSSYVPVGLSLYDADGQLVASGIAQPNVSRGFVVWDPWSVEVGENRVVRAVVSGVANRTAIDDMKNCIPLSLDVAVGLSLEAITALAENGALPPAVVRHLEGSLENAVAAAQRGNPTASTRMLQAFVRQIEAMVRSRRLTAEEAAGILDPVRGLLELLGT
jgi:hypothetical protein